MPVATRVLVASRRLFSSKSPKTSVLFLHFGQPKSAFYAKEFLHSVAVEFYGLTKYLNGIVPSSFHINRKIAASVNEYDRQEKLQETVGRLANSVESSLASLVPEFGPVSCHFSFPYDTNSLEQDIRRIASQGTNHLILFPLYGHYSCSQAGLLLNSASRILFNTTSPARINGNLVDSIRIVPNSESSFELSAVHRWHYHPSLSDLWSDQLNRLKDSFDAVVFSSPAMRGYGRQDYHRAVWTTCDKTMQKVEKSVPWSLGVYNSWMESPLPLRNSLISKVRRLAGNPPSRRRVAVVSVSELFPSFDTFSVLPSLLSKEPDVFLVSPPSSSEILVHGVAEVLKNHLLGRRDAQLQQFCRGCQKKDCEYTRLLLAQ